MSTFADLWPTLPIPAEYDAMDALDQERWRGVVELAYIAGATMAYKASRDAALIAWAATS